MIGAIIGDVVGSVYEFNNIRRKDFPLFKKGCFPTDDTVMTLAVAKSLKNYGGDIERLKEICIKNMQEIGRKYPNCGYGGRFEEWVFSANPKPYNSFGNGAAMRISPVGFFAKTTEEAVRLATAVTEITHNHPEGIKGACCVASCIHAAKRWSKDDIRKIAENYGYDIDFTLADIRKTYRFDETCQGSVPQAIKAFLEAEDFEDAIRNAISIGGDSDTIAAITGGIAEAYFGVPEWINKKALSFLDPYLLSLFKNSKVIAE